MKKNIIIGVLVILLIVLVLMFSFDSDGDVTTDDVDADDDVVVDDSGEVGEVGDDGDDGDVDDSGDTVVGPQTHTVEITLFRFSPTVLIIKAGDTVNFVSIDSAGRWVASTPQSTHNNYPGSHINKCGTSEEDEIFDSCGSIAWGEIFSFTFNEKGTWRYHDHKSDGTRGTIVVE